MDLQRIVIMSNFEQNINYLEPIKPYRQNAFIDPEYFSPISVQNSYNKDDNYTNSKKRKNNQVDTANNKK